MAFELKFLKSYRPSREKTRKHSRVFSIIAALLFVLSTSYLLYIPPQKVSGKLSLKEGDIAAEDIIIKKDITTEDAESTAEHRQQAKEEVTPVYEFLQEEQTKARDSIQEWFRLIRETKKDYIKNNKQKEKLAALKNRIAEEFGLEFKEKEVRTILNSDFFNKVDPDPLLNLVKSLYDKQIIASLVGAHKSNKGFIQLRIKKDEPTVLKIDTLHDLKAVKTALTGFVKDQGFRTPSVEFTVSVLAQFISANISYSKNLTEKEEQKAVAAVNPVMVKLKAGQVILRKGDEASPSKLKVLKLLEGEMETQEQQVSNFYLIFLVLLFLTLFGSKFFNIWTHSSINKDKLFVVMGATITVSAIIYRVSLFLFPLILKNLSYDITFSYDIYSIFFAIPFSFGVLTIAFVFNLQSAVIFSFVNAIIGAMICDWDFRIFLYILLGNLAVSYGIEFYQRLKRSPIIKASFLWLLPTNLLMIMVFHVTGSGLDWTLLLVNLMMGVISAMVSPVIANFTAPLWEGVFQLVTELKLVELTNLNLPIFREMLEKAPGTYHHSLMVASLSEAAAQEMNLSPLLERAMALYHDIGKIDGPHYFTENHTLYRNPHPDLSPRESAKNIIAHIEDGVERGKKLNLPPMVMDAIKQHHGNKVVRFFYDKALEMSSVDSDGLDDNIFRYPGDKPRDIENAIIMLADQVEAASKSLASPTDEELKNVIRKIIDANIEEAQFDECEGLTFKSLNIIANSFHKKLHSIYHMRVSYPGFDFKEKKEKETVTENGRAKVITGNQKTIPS
ncbi:MAG: HDIG domain-containing protein [bacterium]|nr:HDIG domain-containing protein [bacterium]